MKTIHNILLLFLAVLVVGGLLQAQTPRGTVIRNTGRVGFQYLNGSAAAGVQSNTVSTSVAGIGKLAISKTVAPSVALPGDTVMFSIVLTDSGSANLVALHIVDTVSTQFAIVSAPGAAQEGDILIWDIASLAESTSDTLHVRVVVGQGVAYGTTLSNTASARDSSGSTLTATTHLQINSIPHYTLRKSVSRTSVNAGDTLVYTLSYANDGNVTGSNVSIIDTLPQSTIFISATHGGSTSNGIVTWSIGALNAGTADSVSVTVIVSKNIADSTRLANVARLASDNGSPVTSNISTTVVKVWHPKLDIAKTASADSLSAGDNIRYVIRLSNSGDTTLTNVRVVDTLSSYLRNTAVSSNAVIQNGAVLYTKNVLAVGARDSIVISATLAVNMPAGIILKNNAVASSDQTPIGETSAQSYILPLQNAGMTVTKIALRDSVFMGDTVSYRIVIRNSGQSILTSITVNDTLSAGLTAVRVSANARQNGSVINFDKDTLTIGERDTITILVRLDTTLADGHVLRNVAHAKSDETADVTGLALVVAKIVPRPVLAFGKNVNTDTVTAGNTVRYTIWFRNAGNIPLTNLSIADTLPPQLVSASTSKGSVSQDSIINFTLSRLEVGGSDTITITARLRGDIGANEKVFNTAHAFTDETGAAVASASFIGRLIPLADLTISKHVSADTVLANGSPVYTIRFRNTGNVPLTGVTITDTIPMDLAVLSVSKGVADNNRFIYTRPDTLNIGQEDTLSIQVWVSKEMRPRRTFVNTAYARSNEAPPRSDAASFVTAIIPAPALDFSKSVSRDTVLLGDTLRYVIRLKNTGNDDLTNVIVTDTVPSQFVNIHVSPNASSEGSVIRYSNKTLAFGAQDSILITVTMSAARLVAETIVNTAHATMTELPPMTARATVHSKFIVVNRLDLRKTVSADTILVGNTLSYIIRFANSGNVTLHNVVIVDTLPALLTNVILTGEGSYNGRWITIQRDSLVLGQADSIAVQAMVPVNTANKAVIINTAYGASNETDRQTAQAVTVTKVVVIDHSCFMQVGASPKLIVGDGVQSAVISAMLTDETGRPKPDGTPVLFKTTVGTFSNSKDSIVVPTIGGLASDSIRVWLPVNSIVTALATVSSRDSDICFASDSVRVVVYPRAVSGIITDHITRKPVQGGLVSVSTKDNTPVGSMTTGADGRYLLPIQVTGDYQILISVSSIYTPALKIPSVVHVEVPGSGGLPPVPNTNAISGTIYYGASNTPLRVAGVKLLLFPAPAQTPKTQLRSVIQNLTAIDSTATDSLGSYLFTRQDPGTYIVELLNADLQGAITVDNSQAGHAVINANIAVFLTNDLVFTKTGPANVVATDTVSYTISARNTSSFAMTGITVVDTLDPLMVYLGSSDGGHYRAADRTITWQLGNLASQGSRDLHIQVSFNTEVSTLQTAVNRASITSDQTGQESAQARTTVKPASKLRIWKVVSSSEAALNDSLAYTIHIKNMGGLTSDSLTVSDVLPKEVIYNSTRPSVPYDSVTRSMSWFVDSLQAGQEKTFNIYVHVRPDLPPGEHRYTNVATLVWRGGRASSMADPGTFATTHTIITYITIAKQALQKIIEVGDAVTYSIRVTNMSPDTPAETLLVDDHIPAGFTYQKGSSTRDGKPLRDPKGDRDLVWKLLDTLYPNQTVTLTYRLIAGAGAVNGDGINTAQAKAQSAGSTALATSRVQERVEIRRGLFSEHGIIIGKVFYDDNLNAYQDPGEDGVKGVELMMEDGSRVITGDDGKYSLPDVIPGQHVIRVREASLPPNSELHAGYGSFAGDPSSRFVYLTESGIARADFYIHGTAKPEVLTEKIRTRQGIAPVGELSLQRIVEPRNIVFTTEEQAAPMKLSGSQFEVGKATLRAEAYPILRGIADLLREYAAQTLTVAGHTDSMPIHTTEFPSNKELSEARANAVKNYLVSVEHIDSNRITTAGFGESRPIMTNSTKEGRTANRRVELHLSGAENQPKEFVGVVSFTIPISLTGGDGVRSLEIHDVLDTAYHFIAGSGKLGDREIAPRINGNTLTWAIDTLGDKFDEAITYKANVDRPLTRKVSITSQSSVVYATVDTTIIVHDAAVATNELAIAVKAKGMKFTLSGVTFDVGKATLRQDMLGNLQNVVDILKNNPQATVTIDGHTDSNPIHTQEFASNVELSHARSNAVLDYLVAQTGLARKQFSAFGWGEMRPIATNSTAEGRQANRRVEIQIFKKESTEQTITGGLIDSSEVVTTPVMQSKDAPATDSSGSGRIGDRFRFRLEVSPALSADMISRIVVDSLPAGLQLVANSIEASLAANIVVNGSVISVTDTTCQGSLTVSFTGEIAPDAAGIPALNHRFTVVRKFKSAPDAVDMLEPIVISVKTR